MTKVAFLSPDDDPFETSHSGKYDPAKVYIHSTDSRGHFDELRAKVPQGMPAQINELVRKCPEFRSQQDFVRNAVVHAMAHWADVSKNRDVMDYVDVYTRIAEMERVQQHFLAYQEHLVKTKETLDMASSKRDPLMAKMAVRVAEDALEAMEEPWATELRGMINSVKVQFGLN